MATHFICQSTEPLPHNYPTGLPGKSHGAVSQYELYNSGNKPHTRFPPPGWDFSQTSEEDSLPLLQPAPQPELKNSSFHFDPDLCVTPQRSKVAPVKDDNIRRPEFQPDPDLTLTPQKAIDFTCENDSKNITGKKNKVRFDLDESVASSDTNLNGSLPAKSYPSKPYQPELYGDDDDDEFDQVEQQISDKIVGDDNARTVKYTVGKVNNKPVYVALDDTEGSAPILSKHSKSHSQQKSKKSVSKSVKVVREVEGMAPQPSIKSVIQTETTDKSDPIAACKMPETAGAKRKVKVSRENQYTPKETEYSFPFAQNGQEYVGGEEHMFARPEYNSTLRMKLEAERLKESKVDIELALHRKLTVSETVKTEINEKAASHVNTDGQAFSGLVSLKVPVEEMCKVAVEQKTARAKQVKFPKSKTKAQKEPDVLEFFSADRQKESVTFSLPGVAAPSEQLSTASNWRAFDLYKHNRVWNSTTSRK